MDHGDSGLERIDAGLMRLTGPHEMDELAGKQAAMTSGHSTWPDANAFDQLLASFLFHRHAVTQLGPSLGTSKMPPELSCHWNYESNQLPLFRIGKSKL